MGNFVICTDHTVSELTIEADGEPGCVFCKVEQLSDALAEALDLALLGENQFGSEQLARVEELRAKYLGRQ